MCASVLSCCTLLLALLFNPDVLVLQDWIGATVSLRKQCKSIKGTACRKKLCLIDSEERKCDEKTIDLKVGYLS